MERTSVKTLDIAEKAEAVGIDVPVSIEDTLIQTLTPSPFLAEMGVTMESRIENLLSIVKANMDGKERKGASTGKRDLIPFMVVNGPFVKEEFISVLAEVTVDGDGNPAVIIGQIVNDEP